MIQLDMQSRIFERREPIIAEGGRVNVLIYPAYFEDFTHLVLPGTTGANVDEVAGPLTDKVIGAQRRIDFTDAAHVHGDPLEVCLEIHFIGHRYYKIRMAHVKECWDIAFKISA